MKRLLIVFHSHGGRSARLAWAAFTGAQSEADTETCLLHAPLADLDALLAADGLLLVGPENFGSMSGLIKDFLERTYYPAQDRTNGLPYALIVSCGNDGRGAVREIGRIANGYGWRLAAPALILRGDPDTAALAQAQELGAALAAGLALGIF